MVVMMPEAMLKVSLSILTTGARQFVVQLALEMMLCFAASYLPSLTPRTTVMSSLLAGAEMMTFLTVLPRWAFAFSASVKKPVDSMTIWAPTEAQSSLAGSRSAKTLICLPSTAMKSAPWVILFGRLPRMESYLRRWARVAGVVRSFTATNSMSGLPIALRKTLRPMRPKPLMPTFTAAMISVAPIVMLRGYLRVLTFESAAKSLAPTISDAITGVRPAQMLERGGFAGWRGRCVRFAGCFCAVLQA